jgi:hypothetical protein
MFQDLKGQQKYVNARNEAEGTTLPYEQLFHVEKDPPGGPRPALTIHLGFQAHQPWEKTGSDFEPFGKPS